MADAQALVLVPGLLCTADLYAAQIAGLGGKAAITVADHTRHDSMAGIARAILAAAPDRFALAGLSMGGYIAFEIMRQAPERVAKLALINTQARPDTPEASARRRGMMARATSGEYRAVLDELFAGFVHPSRGGDAGLQQLVHDMGEDVGVDGFIRQQMAVISRPDSRPMLAGIRCPTLVLSGDEDRTIPNALSVEMANNIHNARLVILPDCGHLPQPEQPEATAKALVEWLSA